MKGTGWEKKKQFRGCQFPGFSSVYLNCYVWSSMDAELLSHSDPAKISSQSCQVTKRNILNSQIQTHNYKRLQNLNSYPYLKGFRVFPYQWAKQILTDKLNFAR